MNPIQILKTFMGKGGNPEQLILKTITGNNSNPMIENLVNMAKKRKFKRSRNIC